MASLAWISKKYPWSHSHFSAPSCSIESCLICSVAWRLEEDQVPVSDNVSSSLHNEVVLVITAWYGGWATWEPAYEMEHQQKALTLLILERSTIIFLKRSCSIPDTATICPILQGWCCGCGIIAGLKSPRPLLVSWDSELLLPQNSVCQGRIHVPDIDKRYDNIWIITHYVQQERGSRKSVI